MWSELIYFKTPSQSIIYSETIIWNISLPLKYYQNCLHSLPCCRRRRHEMTSEDLEHASSEDSCYVRYKQFWNRISEMVGFELGKEIENDVFSSCHERRSPHDWESEPQTSDLNRASDVFRIEWMVSLSMQFPRGRVFNFEKDILPNFHAVVWVKPYAKRTSVFKHKEFHSVMVTFLNY